MLDQVQQVEESSIQGLKELESQVTAADAERAAALLNAYTTRVYDDAVSRWSQLEAAFWQRFGLGF